MISHTDDKFEYKPPVTCVRCGKVLQALEPATERDYGMVNDGVVGKLYSPYGSENDGTVYQIGICDECIKICLQEKKLKEIGDYIFSDLNEEIKKR